MRDQLQNLKKANMVSWLHKHFLTSGNLINLEWYNQYDTK